MKAYTSAADPAFCDSGAYSSSAFQWYRLPPEFKEYEPSVFVSDLDQSGFCAGSVHTHCGHHVLPLSEAVPIWRGSNSFDQNLNVVCSHTSRR